MRTIATRIRRLVRRMGLAALCAAIFFGVGAGCAGRRSALPDTGSPNGQSEQEADFAEQGRAFDEEQELRGVLLADEVVQSYVTGIGERLVPSDLAGEADLRYFVLRSPEPFGFSLPHGSIYLSVGLLYAIENEAELSQVIGHEIAHVVYRHSLARMRDRHAKATLVQLTDMATLGIGGSLANYPYVLSITRYSRAMEADADEWGLRAVVEAGYDAGEAVGFYETLRASGLATLDEEPSPTATHPTLGDRTASLTGLLESGKVSTVDGGRIGQVEHARVRDRIRNEYLRLLRAHSRFELLRFETTRLIDAADAASYRCYRGDAALGMADDPEALALERAAATQSELTDESIKAARSERAALLDAAAKDFARCRELSPESARAWRGLGLVAFAAAAADGDDTARDRVTVGSADGETAVEALERYLELEPRALDRRYIRRVIDRATEREP